MRIGIDARLYGPQDTGIGRYVANLVKELGEIDSENTYLIFGHEKIKTEITAYPNFVYIPLKTPIYSLAEQLINPFIFKSYHLDLLHIPHLNAPLLYQGKLVVTIHDLIKHLSVGHKTSTLPTPLYYLKYFAYKILLRLILLKAEKIITPTNYWRDYLIEHFNLNIQKVISVPEGVDKSLTKIGNGSKNHLLKKYKLKKPFLIYTGNLYPHKNVDLVIKAVRLFNKEHNHQLQLAIVCARSIFQERYPSDDTVKVLGFVPDADLASLYHHALALVQPSFIEGFGLTGLEAMANNLPVLSSNTSCLPEVYGNAALYFDPKSVTDLATAIHLIITDQEKVKDLVAKGRQQVSNYSFVKMAKSIQAVYTSVR